MEVPTLAKKSELEKTHQENLEFLTEIELPDSIEWMEANLPGKAYPYICEADKAMKRAIYHTGDEAEYKHQWEKYNKAWLRVWQLMAKEHFHSRDILDVDMRYFRHLPDGYSFVMDSSVLKCKILVLPRKPRKPPEDMRYITAGELIKIHENPIIMKFIVEFDAWFDRDGKKRTKDIMERAIEASKKRAAEIAAAGGGLKLKRRKGGVEYYG
jgi:hypothetical protein